MSTVVEDEKSGPVDQPRSRSSSPSRRIRSSSPSRRITPKKLNPRKGLQSVYLPDSGSTDGHYNGVSVDAIEFLAMVGLDVVEYGQMHRIETDPEGKVEKYMSGHLIRNRFVNYDDHLQFLRTASKRMIKSVYKYLEDNQLFVLCVAMDERRIEKTDMGGDFVQEKFFTSVKRGIMNAEDIINYVPS